MIYLARGSGLFIIYYHLLHRPLELLTSPSEVTSTKDLGTALFPSDYIFLGSAGCLCIGSFCSCLDKIKTGLE